MRFHSVVLSALLASAVVPTWAQSPPEEPESWIVQDVLDVVAPSEDSYDSPETKTATKTPTPIERTPQSIQTLTATLIEEQDLRTLSAALQNVSNVTPAKPIEVVLIDPLVRGFDADVLIDGLSAYGITSVVDPASLINTERIEVAKGPSSTLYGGGVGSALGGLINVVSKSPTADRKTIVGLRGGSHKTFGGFLDFNLANPTSGKFRFRLTGEVESSDTAIEAVDSDRQSFHPSLSITLGNRTELSIRGQYSDNRYREYSGLPADLVLSSSFRGDPFQFSGAPDAPRNSVENRLLTATFDHRFSADVEASITARHYESEFDEIGSFIFPAFFPPQGSTYALIKGRLPAEVQESTLAATLFAEKTSGNVRHRVLVGADHDDTDYFARLGFDFFPIGFIDYGRRGPRPTFGALPELTAEQDDRFRTTAVYAQDQIAIGERLDVTAGLRWSQLDLNQRSNGVKKTYDEWTPRLGVTFQARPGVALFAGYSEGFRGVLNFLGLKPPVPETSLSWEAGVKLAKPVRGLSATFAAFEITRQNVPTPDPANPFFQIQTGEQRSRGLEVDAIWEPVSAFSLLANYAFLDAEVTRDELLPVGDRLRRSPKHSGRLAARYRFPEGRLARLEIGGGVTARSRREITVPNVDSTPGYWLADAQASYELGRVSLALSITNLTDAEELDPFLYLDQSVVAPVEGRAAFLTIRTHF